MHVYIYICVYIHICAYAYVYVCMYAYIYVCVRMCTCVFAKECRVSFLYYKGYTTSYKTAFVCLFVLDWRKRYLVFVKIGRVSSGVAVLMGLL
jgi:hypothetical protein